MPRDKVPGTLYACGTVEIQAAAEGSGDLPKFRMNAYNGGAMRVAGWPELVVVDLAGMRVTAKSRPVLRDHDAGKIVGHTDEVDIQPKRLDIGGTISADNLFAREVATSARNKFPWQSSIGAAVEKVVFVEDGETATANGRTFTGPVYIARRSRLDEVSFVALGADDSTSARLAAAAAEHTVRVNPMTLETFVAEKGFVLADLDEKQSAYFKAEFERSKAPPPPAPPAAPATPPAAPPPVQATAPGTQTLDQIFAARRAEDARVAEITRITAEAVNDRPMLTDEFERMSRAAIEAKTDPKEYELVVLRASRAPATVASRGAFGRDRRVGERVVAAAICATVGLKDIEKHFDEQTLQAAHERFPHGISLCEMFLMAGRENGHTDISSRNIPAMLRAAFPQEVRAQGWSTFSLSGILGNVANKFIAAGFNNVESSWRQIASTRSVRDFKTITSYSLTGGMMYEKVGPQGELKHAELGEQSYTNKVETYGRMFSISRQDIINDDLGVLDGLRQRIGRGGALKMNDVFWTEFMDNATFFTSGRGNYTSGAGTALSIDALTTGETLFLNQTDPDGFPLGAAPRILLVANANSVKASQLMSETRVIDGTGTALQPASNPHAGKYRVVTSSYLSNTSYTGNSTTAWYLLADPNDLPVIEVALLNGKDMPTVESADADFNTLGVQFRGYHDFGANLQEYRAGVKVAGA